MINAIFNINKKRLPLLIIIKIINLDKIFLIIFNYYFFKSNLAFKFFFKYLNKEYFINKIIEFKIIFKNQITNLISTFLKF